MFYYFWTLGKEEIEMNRKVKKVMSILSMMVLLAVSCFGGLPAAAADQTTGSLTLTKAEPGTVFHLYQIETKNTDGTCTVTSEFSSLNINLTEDSKVDLRTIATTLSNYITSAGSSSKPKEAGRQTAGEDGTAVFSNLVPGMYLVLADALTKDGTDYYQAPVLTFLPYTDADGSAVYDQEAEVKPDNTEGSTTHKVIKIWSGDSESSRPASIVVELLKNGKSTGQKVTLNKDNNWQYTWKNLEKGTYSVKEVSVPDGYKVSVTDNNGVSTVRNTKPTTPSNPPGGNTPPGGGSKIPQTGQLWWPVMILASLGLVCILIGLVVRRRNERENGRA